MISLYIGVDACPVKREIYRGAERHAEKGATSSSWPDLLRPSTSFLLKEIVDARDKRGHDGGARQASHTNHSNPDSRI
jgi:uncharacterized protein YaiI (UPF0178 family)